MIIGGLGAGIGRASIPFAPRAEATPAGRVLAGLVTIDKNAADTRSHLRIFGADLIQTHKVTRNNRSFISHGATTALAVGQILVGGVSENTTSNVPSTAGLYNRDSTAAWTAPIGTSTTGGSNRLELARYSREFAGAMFFVGAADAVNSAFWLNKTTGAQIKRATLSTYVAGNDSAIEVFDDEIMYFCGHEQTSCDIYDLTLAVNATNALTPTNTLALGFANRVLIRDGANMIFGGAGGRLKVFAHPGLAELHDSGAAPYGAAVANAAATVEDIIVTENGLIVAGMSDGYIRVFSSSLVFQREFNATANNLLWLWKNMTATTGSKFVTVSDTAGTWSLREYDAATGSLVRSENVVEPDTDISDITDVVALFEVS